MRANKIRILNPIGGGGCWTGRNRAERYVKSKRAGWVGDSCIRFVETDPRNGAAVERAKAAAAHYDGIKRLMTESELAHVPVLTPKKLYWKK